MNADVDAIGVPACVVFSFCVNPGFWLSELCAYYQAHEDDWGRGAGGRRKTREKSSRVRDLGVWACCLLCRLSLPAGGRASVTGVVAMGV